MRSSVMRGTLLWLVVALECCRAEYSSNDCLVGDLRTVDCRYGTFVIDADHPLPAPEMISQFSMKYMLNWTDPLSSLVLAEQRVAATLSEGTLRYFYTKLTDQPESKLVDDLAVFVTVGSSGKTRQLHACDVAADLSDVDSRKWEDCHMLLDSQHYVAIKVYVPEGEVGVRKDCPSCSSASVSIVVKYSMSNAVCSADATSTQFGNKTYEGRSYMRYMRDWEVFPDQFVLDFDWPVSSSPTECYFNAVQLPLRSTADGHGAWTRAVLKSQTDIENIEYLSWQPTDYKGECYYGSPPASRVADVFLSLFIVSVVICSCMVILLGWSKYAAWQWYGGDFEWDVKSVDENSDAGDGQAKTVKKKAEVGNLWGERRRLSLKALSVKNWMYSKNGEDPMGASASGNMDIEMSTSRKRQSSIDISGYLPAESLAVMNPLFSKVDEDHQDRIAAFRPTVALKAKPEDSFDWSQFGDSSSLQGDMTKNKKYSAIGAGEPPGTRNEVDVISPMFPTSTTDV